MDLIINYAQFFFFFCFGFAMMYSDAASVMAAVAVANASPRLSALKESPFLPSVSGESGNIFREPNGATNG